MVKTLTKKLLRDLWNLRGQVITIALVVASGVSVFIAAYSTYESLQRARSTFYTQYHFADIFADLKSAPDSTIDKLKQIHNVSQVETRVVYDAVLDIPTLKEPATGQFISLPDKNISLLNQLYLRQGRWLDPDSPNEVLVNESFAQAHHLKPGDHIIAVLKGHQLKLQITGIVLSPEYIYAIQNNSLLPDNLHFGIFWMNREPLAAAIGMKDAFNNFSLTLAPHANKNAVIDTIEHLMSSYGLYIAYDRSDQISDRFVSNEIMQQKILATSIPPIFLIVAAFLLHMITGRLVGKQREQIATLKSLGYSNWSVGIYYLKFVLVIVFIGSIIGCAAGIWLGQQMTYLYTDYFHFPVFNYHFSPWVALLSIMISLLAAITGALGSVRQVISLAPAQAMRPPSPTQYRRIFFEQTTFFQKISPSIKMIMRTILRKPLVTLSVSISIGLSIAIVILGLFWSDAVRFIIDTQFLLAQREDALITFTDPVSHNALREIQQLKGITSTEGYRIVPVRMRNQHYSYLSALFGIPHDANLKLLLNESSQPMQIPPHGILISKMVADQLHVTTGDIINVELLEDKRTTTHLQITGIVNDFIGASGYADISTVNRLLDESNNISTAAVLIDPLYTASVYSELKNIPKISTVAFKQMLIDTFEETFAKHLLVFTTFLAGFAIIIAVGVIYNTARITLAERAWELATLRVLGFTIGEVSTILLGAIAIEIIISIPIGFLIGYFLAKLALYGMQTDWFKIPFIIEPDTYVIAALIALVSGIISAYIVKRKIREFDLVAVLKVTD